MTPLQRLEIDVALDAVKMHQEELWAAMRELERLVDALEETENALELSGDTDYAGYTIKNLIDMTRQD